MISLAVLNLGIILWSFISAWISDFSAHGEPGGVGDILYDAKADPDPDEREGHPKIR